MVGAGFTGLSTALHLCQPEPRLICCMGYNGRGVALSTAMGREMARLATGTRAADIDMPVTTVKPITLHGFWRPGVSAKVLEGRIKDRLGL